MLQNIIFPPVRIDSKKLSFAFSGKWVVVTGASHGIGEAMVRMLISAHANLYLISRTESELQHLCETARLSGCKADYCAVDLRDKDKLQELCDSLREKLPQVDYLFCNAGKSIHRSILDSTGRMHDFDRTMDLNYRSMVALSLALLPLLKRNRGCIIYTSSVSTLFPDFPGWSAYHASKRAANAWCRTFQNEYNELCVKMKIAYLPLVHTAMSDVNETYRNMPAYSSDEAAGILLKLALSHKSSYKPWWTTFTVPLASLFYPIVISVYKNFSRKE